MEDILIESGRLVEIRRSGTLRLTQHENRCSETQLKIRRSETLRLTQEIDLVSKKLGVASHVGRSVPLRPNKQGVPPL